MPSSDVLRIERRPPRQNEKEFAMLERVGLGARTLADVTRAAYVTRQHIDQWRQEMRRKGFGPLPDGALFVPVGQEAREMPCEISVCGSELRCLIPRFDDVMLSQERKDARWDKAPRRRTPSEQQ